jgi:hypothetical protein
MATATYANVFVNGNSSATSISFNPFDQTKYSSFNASSSVNNCTYDSSNGRITVGEDGNYLILFAPIIDGSTSGNNPNVKTTIKVDGAEVYSVSYNVYSTYGRQERTSHKVLNISSGSYVEAFLEETDAGAEDIYSVQGTSIQIQRLYGDFGTLSLVGDNALTSDATEVFPFFTGSAPGSSSTLSSSFNGNMSLNESKGGIQTSVGGPALFLTTQYLEGTVLNPTLDIRYYKNASSQWTTPLRKSRNDDPTEGTTIALENYSADDFVRISVQGTSTSNHRTNASSSMSLMSIPSDNHYSFVHVNTDSDSLNAFAYYNVLSSSIYSGNGYSVVSSSNGIIFDSDTGRFNVTRDGSYLMLATNYVFASADLTIFPTFREDGNLITQANSGQDTADDPGETTAMYVFPNVTSGSYLELTVAASAQYTIEAGTAVAVIEMYSDATPTPSGPPTFNQGSASGLISDDFTINTFSQDNLSVQYDRTGTAQVPFILGQPGPLRIRNRSLAQVIKTGDKKN